MKRYFSIEVFFYFLSNVFFYFLFLFSSSFFFFFFSFRQGVLWSNNLSQSHNGTAQKKELTPRLFWLIHTTLCTKSRKRRKLCAILLNLQLFLTTSYWQNGYTEFAFSSIVHLSYVGLNLTPD